MKIQTNRLYLYPISDEEMGKMVSKEDNSELRKAYLEMLEDCINEPENRIWYAVWNIELKEEPGIVVGNLGFKGLNTNGMVEIGYGLYKDYYGNGYMTEAVKSISEWALTQEHIRRVEAETTPDNIASQKVLLRAGFVPTGRVGREGPRFIYKGAEEA